jgi:hypothetical protein
MDLQAHTAGKGSSKELLSDIHVGAVVGCCPQAPFDIMGMITSVGTVGSVKRKADNSDVTRREVTLADSR